MLTAPKQTGLPNGHPVAIADRSIGSNHAEGVRAEGGTRPGPDPDAAANAVRSTALRAAREGSDPAEIDDSGPRSRRIDADAAPPPDPPARKSSAAADSAFIMAPRASGVAQISVTEAGLSGGSRYLDTAAVPDLLPVPAAHGSDPGSPANRPIFAPTLHGGPTVASQIAPQLGAALQSGAEGTTELRLDPPELGRVRIQISGGEAGLQANISADRQETLDLIRRNVEILRRDLAEAGIGSADLSFSEWTGAGRQEHPSPFARLSLSAQDAAAPAATAQPLPTSSGMDRRI